MMVCNRGIVDGGGGRWGQDTCGCRPHPLLLWVQAPSLAPQEYEIPFVFTDYSEQSLEKGLALAADLAGMSPSLPVALNPFRAPLRLPLVRGGAVGFPTLSNGFVAAFYTACCPEHDDGGGGGGGGGT